MPDNEPFLFENIIKFATKHNLNDCDTKSLFQLIFQQHLVIEEIPIDSDDLVKLEDFSKKIQLAYKEWQETLHIN